jgi:hypothetical protein
MRLYNSLLHEAAKPNCNIGRRTVKRELDGGNVAQYVHCKSSWISKGSVALRRPLGAGGGGGM